MSAKRVPDLDTATLEKYQDEINRELARRSGDSTDEAQEWRDFFTKGIETIAGQRYEIKRLNDRIASLEDGECRFHCRVRSAMWKAGFKWEQEHWPGLHRASADQIEEQYQLWRNQHDPQP